MKVSIVLFVFLCSFIPTLSHSQVVCDRYEINNTLNGSRIDLSLDTNLPDDTGLSILFYRVYHEKGENDAYLIDYYREKSQVGNWRTTRTVFLDNDKWKSDLRDKQKKTIASWFGF